MEKSIGVEIHDQIATVDLHLHSHASNTTDYYMVNTLHIPESYSNPIQTYWQLKKKGRTLVTLTDHNTIDGVKTLLDAGLPGVFISSEITATFPEDGCNVHIIVLNMSESQFADTMRLRDNVYEMLSYRNAQVALEAKDKDVNKLAYFLAHPLMSTQNRSYGREGALSLSHIEKALLLFECFEVRNGARTQASNDMTVALLHSLDRETIMRLAEKHRMSPIGQTPWCKAVVGGSDDHSGLNPGNTYTAFTHPSGSCDTLCANDLINAIRTKSTKPVGVHGGPITLAAALMKLLYLRQFHQPEGSRTRVFQPIGRLNHMLGRLLSSDPCSKTDLLRLRAQSWLSLMLTEVRSRLRTLPTDYLTLYENELNRLFLDQAFVADLAALPTPERKTFAVLNRVINATVTECLNHVRRSPADQMLTAVSRIAGPLLANCTISLPYLISYIHQGSEKFLFEDLQAAFGLERPQHVLLATDTLVEVNGVSRTIRNLMTEAERRSIALTVMTSLGAEEMEGCMTTRCCPIFGTQRSCV